MTEMTTEFVSPLDRAPEAVAERAQQLERAYLLFIEVLHDFFAAQAITNAGEWRTIEKAGRNAEGTSIIHPFALTDGTAAFYFIVVTDWTTKNNVVHKVNRAYIEQTTPEILTPEMMAIEETNTEEWCTNCRPVLQDVSA